MASSGERDITGSDVELGESEARVRPAASPAGRVVFWAGVIISSVHVYFNTIGTLSELWTSAIHFGSFGFLCALLFPMAMPRSHRLQKVVMSIDSVLGVLAILCVAYLIYNEEALFDRGVRFLPSDWIVSIIGVALAIEFTRRTTGWIIPALILLSLAYVVWLGRYISGVFHFPGLTLETVLFRIFYGADGMFGTIARISSTYVFMFILFGAFLVRSGAGDFIINLARCIAGRFVGGPGLVAVLGSGLMGSISGSAVANTVGTGVITIPLMKRAGFGPPLRRRRRSLCLHRRAIDATDHGRWRVHYGQLYPDPLSRHHRPVCAAGHHVFPFGRFLGPDRGKAQRCWRP